METVFGVTEDMAYAAIFEDRPMTLKFTIGQGAYAKELDLPLMWPDGDDEKEINGRAADFLGFDPNFATLNDKAWARGRAIIEVLAHDPYPEWLSGPSGEYLNKKQPVQWRGKTRVQPDTGRLKSRAFAVAVYSAYSAVIERFHVLAAG